MFLEKVEGSEDGRYVNIGGITFLTIGFYAKADVENQLVGRGWVYRPVPYAFRKDGVWVISENPRARYGYRAQYVGVGLNALDRDKSKRIPRKEFLSLYREVYKEALRRELSVDETPFYESLIDEDDR